MVEIIKNSNSKGPDSTIIGKFNNSSIKEFYSNIEEENVNQNEIFHSNLNEINLLGKGGFSRVYEDKLEIKVAKKK